MGSHFWSPYRWRRRAWRPPLHASYAWPFRNWFKAIININYAALAVSASNIGLSGRMPGRASKSLSFVLAFATASVAVIGGLTILDLPREPDVLRIGRESSLPAFGGKRGVAIVQTFMFPAKNAAGRYVDDPYVPHWSAAMPAKRMRELKRSGFDFVRISVDPGPLLEGNSQTRERLISEILSAVQSTVAQGLKALVDVHPAGDGSRWDFSALTAGLDAPALQQLIEVERALAALLAAFDPGDVALELFNEPPSPCQWSDRDDWPRQLKQIYDRVREVAPKLTLFVAGACWASIEGLMLLDPEQFDPNTLFVFHFYEPFVFTHQGYWGSRKYLQFVPPLAFPPIALHRDTTIAGIIEHIHGTTGLAEGEHEVAREARRALRDYFDGDQDQGFIAARLQEVASWADRHGLDRERIVLGEFGCMREVYGKKGATPDDRARWIETTRRSAERYGFRWAVWSLTNTMGIVTGDLDGKLDVTIVKALGLNHHETRSP